MRRLRAVLMCCALLLPLARLAPSPAPAHAQAANDEVVVLVDETFDNPDAGEFVEDEGEDFRYVYERGTYVMEGIGSRFDGLLSDTIPDVVADGTIAIDARVRGTVENRFVLVGCRSDGRGGHGYELVIHLASGGVLLYAGDINDNVELLTDFIFHDAIRSDNLTNRLELSCSGSTITGRVNGAEVVSITDDRRRQGSFYFGIGHFNDATGPVEGVFDNLLVTMAPKPNRSARQDAREFDQLREEAQAQPSLFGPAAGEVRADEDGFVSDRYAGVDVRDFYARTTFVVPYDVEERRWDVGIAFRDTGSDEQLRLVLRSTGRWYLTDGITEPILASGLASGMETVAGGENTIEVAVVDETGYLALNGEYLAAFDASPRLDSGDVWVGSGFIEPDNVRGNRTAFREFEVWGLGDDAAPVEPEETPAAEPEVGQPRLPGPRDEPAEPTEEPEAADTVTVELREMDRSGRTGQAMLTAEGERTKVALRVRDVPGDTIVVLQEGPCTALNSESGFELRPLNDAGVSVTRIDAVLADLLVGTYAIVVYDEDAVAGVATLPLVCGEVGNT